MSFQRRLFATLLLQTLTLAGVAAHASSDLDPKEYDKLFPQYAELCAGSQYRDQTDGNGGPNGHAVLFLKGACRDTSAPYPQLKTCDNGPGVGVSTYFAFKNVLWVATEGREFFLHGNIKPTEPVTYREIEKIIPMAQKQGILKNVEMHDWIMKGRAENKYVNKFHTAVDSEGLEPLEHYKYRMSLGTDWAIGLARNVYCSRIPMTKAMVAKAVAHLNEENRKAYTRGPGYEKGYVWDMFTNNCMHTAYNALAASGMWAAKQIKSSKMQVALSKFTDGNLSLAVPFDTWLRVALAGAEPQIRDPRTMTYGAQVIASTVANGWMLQQPGTMVAQYPIHDYKNEYFNADSPRAFAKDQFRGFLDLTPLDIIDPKRNEKLAQSLFEDANNTDLAANLSFSLRRTQQAVSQFSSDYEAPGINTDMFHSYLGFLNSQQERTANMIETVSAQARRGH